MIWVLALGKFDVEDEDNGGDGGGHVDDANGVNSDADVLEDGDLDE